MVGINGTGGGILKKRLVKCKKISVSWGGGGSKESFWI